MTTLDNTESILAELEKYKRENRLLKREINTVGLRYKTIAEEGEAQELLAGKTPTLESNEEYSTVNNGSQRDHLLLEGDNLSSLTLLACTAPESVEVIYIDPPYNTRKRSLTYGDRYEHSTWLSFMRPRLELAKKVLTEDGFIAVSIDNREYHELSLLMKEIFGEDNWITDIVWKSVGKGSESKHVSTETEYIVLYAKNKQTLTMTRRDLSQDVDYLKGYNKEDERGAYKLVPLDGLKDYVKSLDYPIYDSSGKAHYPYGTSEADWKQRQQNNSKQPNYRWVWGKERLQWGMDNDLIVFTDSGRVKYKQYAHLNRSLEPEPRTQAYSNFVPSTQFNTKQGSASLKNVMGAKSFTYPKPVGLIGHIVNLHTNKNARVLDFFAGSGTTGQAVLELNAKDGGDRRFTLCTNNENDIAKNVTAKRIQNVLTGQWADGKEHDSYPQDSLHYFVVNNVNMDDTLSFANENKNKEIIQFFAPLVSIMNNAYSIVQKYTSNYTFAVENESTVYALYADVLNINMGDIDYLYFVEYVLNYANSVNKKFVLYHAGEDDTVTVNDETFVAIPLVNNYVNSVRNSIKGLENSGSLVKE